MKAGGVWGVLTWRVGGSKGDGQRGMGAANRTVGNRVDCDWQGQSQKTCSSGWADHQVASRDCCGQERGALGTGSAGWGWLGAPGSAAGGHRAAQPRGNVVYRSAGQWSGSCRRSGGHWVAAGGGHLAQPALLHQNVARCASALAMRFWRVSSRLASSLLQGKRHTRGEAQQPAAGEGHKGTQTSFVSSGASGFVAHRSALTALANRRFRFCGSSMSGSCSRQAGKNSPVFRRREGGGDGQGRSIRRLAGWLIRDPTRWLIGRTTAAQSASRGERAGPPSPGSPLSGRPQASWSTWRPFSSRWSRGTSSLEAAVWLWIAELSGAAFVWLARRSVQFGRLTAWAADCACLHSPEPDRPPCSVRELCRACGRFSNAHRHHQWTVWPGSLHTSFRPPSMVSPCGELHSKHG